MKILTSLLTIALFAFVTSAFADGNTCSSAKSTTASSGTCTDAQKATGGCATHTAASCNKSKTTATAASDCSTTSASSGSCSKSKAAMAKAGTCPISGDAASSKISYKYKGVTYHFCGKDCKAKFKADPAKYVAAMSTNTSAPASSKQ